MLNKMKKTNRDGFTIIEVMIVLVIAGLILLIVFLAVPALQRGARNTQRKNDVSAILSSMTDFYNDNQSNYPTSVTQWANPLMTFTNASLTSPANTTAKLGFYVSGPGNNQGQVGFAASGTVTNSGFTVIGNDRVLITPGTQCSGNVNAVGPTQGITVVYEIETGNAATPYAEQCQGS